MTAKEFEACSRAFRIWMVEVWNRACPPGTSVVARPRDYETFETRTTCPAFLCFGYPVVKVEGRRGGEEYVDLDQCLPLRGGAADGEAGGEARGL